MAEAESRMQNHAGYRIYENYSSASQQKGWINKFESRNLVYMDLNNPETQRVANERNWTIGNIRIRDKENKTAIPMQLTITCSNSTIGAMQKV